MFSVSNLMHCILVGFQALGFALILCLLWWTISNRIDRRTMKRLCEILRIMFDRAFWREFIDLDMREETRMMHDYE